jgi:two-component system response regulator HydG
MEAATERTGELAAQPNASRRWIWISTAAVLAYAVGLLLAASLSADLGFFTYQRGSILGLSSGSAAAEAGVRAGDVIVAVNGTPTPNAYEVSEQLRRIAPGDQLTLVLARGNQRVTASFTAGRKLPLASAAGILLALLLLSIALIADRGVPGDLPRQFFRSTVVYVIFLAGAFSIDTAMSHIVLAVPWLFSVALAAPVTCHHMLRFPAGRESFSSRELGLLYGPPLALATLLTVTHLTFSFGHPTAIHHAVTVWGGVVAGAMAAAYLSIGAIARGKRLRVKRDEIDPVAARWLKIGGLSMAVPLILATVWALRDIPGFVAGGFRPFIAVAMIGGSACVVLAMMRTPFGELDRLWRRSYGYFVATSLAAGLYLATIAALGGTASALSGGDFQAALAATLVAAVVFGPLRVKLQQVADERFGRSRSRARGLLREAAEAAAATLDLDALQTGVVHRVRSALSAEGAAIYIAETNEDGGWRQAAIAHDVGLPEQLEREHSASATLDAALTARAPRLIAADGIAVPILVDDRAPAALVVIPRNGHRFDDEERELLATAAAGLAIAISNARAHSEMRELTERLQRQVEVAEQRRREIGRLKERVEEENRALIGQLAARQGRAPVIGPGLKPTFALVQKVARADASVLVRGETGVGKELVARAIHAASPRRDAPFIVVDCGAISAGLVESTLFGHERGAFTGAIRATLGAFRAAHGGTIFLDEMGELPRDLQPKLLRVLQEREVTPVGSDKPVPVDVRVVAGTNRDLAADVAAGSFRQDLLYRLQVVEIVIPPLRQRRSDIPALAEHFLARHAERSGRSAKTLSSDAMQALVDHEWPGNVRELENALEAATVYASGDEIRAADLPIFEDVFRQKGKRAISEGGVQVTGHGAPKTGLRETLEELERDRLLSALREHEGNKTRTAKALGMSRGALLRRIKRYDLRV